MTTIHYAIVEDAVLGDHLDEAVVEIRAEGSNYRVSASPARTNQRGLASWTSEVGVLTFKTVDEAKQALEQHFGKLQWATKKEK